MDDIKQINICKYLYIKIILFNVVIIVLYNQRSALDFFFDIQNIITCSMDIFIEN